MLQQAYKYDSRIAAIHKLRVNIKSLVAESKLIRQEQSRCGEVYRNMLSAHRRGTVREEARITHLALAFVRGRTYKSVEAKCQVAPDASRIFKKVKQHIYRTELTDIKAWLV